MRCTNCNCEISGDDKFCVNCGAPVGMPQAPQMAPQAAPVYAPQGPGQGAYYRQPPKKSKAPMIVIICSAVVVAVIAVVLAIVLTRGSGSSSGSGFASSGTSSVSTDSTSGAMDGVAGQSGSAASGGNSGATAESGGTGSATGGNVADYILPDSDIRVIPREQLMQLNEQQLFIARNELYARHGRLFQDQFLQEYFGSKTWYHGHIQPDQFREDMLNPTEVINRDAIVEVEKAKGYRQ